MVPLRSRAARVGGGSEVLGVSTCVCSVRSLCLRAFVEHLLYVRPVLDTSAKTDGPRRRGRGDVEEALLLTRGRNGENVPPGGCWEGLTAGCEYPQDSGGCHLLGVTPPPCSECWAVSILWLRKLSPGEVRVTQAASDRGGATTCCPPGSPPSPIPEPRAVPLSATPPREALGTSARETP